MKKIVFVKDSDDSWGCPDCCFKSNVHDGAATKCVDDELTNKCFNEWGHYEEIEEEDDEKH
jgi:hypothetical protein